MRIMAASMIKAVARCQSFGMCCRTLEGERVSQLAVIIVSLTSTGYVIRAPSDCVSTGSSVALPLVVGSQSIDSP